jgi:hypothetical protein
MATLRVTTDTAVATSWTTSASTSTTCVTSTISVASFISTISSNGCAFVDGGNLAPLYEIAYYSIV